MAGVREQRGGVAEIAIDRFGNDQRGVQRDADRERLAEIGGRMDMRVTMAVAVAMIVPTMIMVVMTVMVVAAQFYRSPEAAKSGAIVGVSLAPSRRNSI